MFAFVTAFIHNIIEIGDRQQSGEKSLSEMPEIIMEKSGE